MNELISNTYPNNNNGENKSIRILGFTFNLWRNTFANKYISSYTQ